MTIAISTNSDITSIIEESVTYELDKGEALYVTPSGDLQVGRNGCQPSGSCCLVVADWETDEETIAVSDMDWLDWSEIEQAIRDWASA